MSAQKFNIRKYGTKGIDYLLIADLSEEGRQIILEERRDIDGVFLGPPLDIVFETIGLKK